jgi:multidrug efflux pump subunit AcrA (membrane-fusion protein)
MEPIATIGCSDKFIIELLVDEVDVVQIREGQQLIVVLDAYGDKTFKADIFKILPEKDYRNQTFTVEARFQDVPERLYPGLSGEANVIIATKKDALVIPREYLIDQNRVLTEAGEVEIEIGLMNLKYIEVLSGITQEDWIQMPER